MRQGISASLFVLGCALAQPSFAQLEDKPVPMDKAPFHIPVFSNDYIFLLNVNIPPGRNTGYHIHYADSVSVNLTPAWQTNQNYGSSEVSPPGTGGEGAPGRVTFTNVTRDGQRTHKATNVGPTPFHNISFILKKSGPAGTTVSDRSGVAGYTRIMDNDRIRAWRVVLKPGEATGQITQSAPGLQGLCPWRCTGRNGAGIGRSWHGSLRRRFHLAGCGADASGEKHRYHPHRICRIRAEITPVTPGERLYCVLLCPGDGIVLV